MTYITEVKNITNPLIYLLYN